MLKLNANQLLWVQEKLSSVTRQRQTVLDKINEAAKTPGSVSRILSWNTTHLMCQDLLLADLTMIIGMTTDEESQATLDSMEEWYTKEIMRWSPQHSTSPCSNIEEECKHEVHQEVLKMVQAIKERK